METILIDWLKFYTQVDTITKDTTFADLNYDLFDEAMTIDFVLKTFEVNININEEWFNTVGDLLSAIHSCKT